MTLSLNLPACRSFFLPLFFCACSLVPGNVAAQLCNGSLGDPVVNITFGSGDGFGQPLSAATTNYKYVYDACPVNGFYTLVNKCVECNYGWHLLQSDHTGNANGYFMLVDASFEPSDFYLDTVKSLCANTTYEFAAWMLNMKYFQQGTRPNITFTIETATGQVLQRYNSGDIPVEQAITWRQYGFYFTTPLNVSTIVLRIKNNAPGGDGNDLAMDDITFRPCGKLITANVQGNTGDTVDICDGNTNVYNFNAAISPGYVSPVYQWQLSTNQGTSWSDIIGANKVFFQRQPTTAGNYYYRFAVTEATAAGATSCRIASNAVVINVHANPMVDAGPDRNLVAGNEITLHANASGDGIALLWSPDNYINDIHLLTPLVKPAQDIVYQLFASTIYGCTNADEVNVKVVSALYVPSAFTPNGDGKNDIWKIPFLDPAYQATVQVFNRFGKLVYQSSGEEAAWDGRWNGVLQPVGSYVYLVNFKADKQVLKGTVSILR